MFLITQGLGNNVVGEDIRGPESAVVFICTDNMKFIRKCL